MAIFRWDHSQWSAQYLIFDPHHHPSSPIFWGCQPRPDYVGSVTGMRGDIYQFCNMYLELLLCTLRTLLHGAIHRRVPIRRALLIRRLRALRRRWCKLASDPNLLAIFVKEEGNHRQQRRHSSYETTSASHAQRREHLVREEGCYSAAGRASNRVGGDG